MKKTHFRVAAMAAVAAAAIAAPAIASHSWSTYHWSVASSPPNSLNLTVVTATTDYWETAIAEAIDDWDDPANAGFAGEADVLQLTRDDNTYVDRKRCQPLVGKVVACNYAYGKRGWLGIATVWLSNGHISQATTKLNDSYYTLGSRYDTYEWRALVACQEIGHDFGLGHQNEGYTAPNRGTCMDYTNDPTGAGAYLYKNITPNKHDYDQLNAIYTAHKHDGSLAMKAVGQINAAVRREAPAGDSPAEWGRPVHFDAEGRPDVYVQDLGPGRRKITHVFWAIGEGPRSHAEH